MLRAVTMRPSRKGGFMSMTIICTLTRSFSSSSFTFVRRTTPLCSKRFSSHITLSWFCCACTRSVSRGQHQRGGAVTRPPHCGSRSHLARTQPLHLSLRQRGVVPPPFHVERVQFFAHIAGAALVLVVPAAPRHALVAAWGARELGAAPSAIRLALSVAGVALRLFWCPPLLLPPGHSPA